MKRIIICALVFIVSLSGSIQAQTFLNRQDLRGARHAGPGLVDPTSADFAIGMSLDGGANFVNTANVNDAVVISGLILPEPAHFNQPADIFVVTRVNQGNFQMLNSDGIYVPWNGEVDLLIPYRANQVLAPEMTVEFFSGQLGVEANHLLYIGYKPAGGTLHYSDIAAELIVTAASGRAEAMAMFTSSISTDIVHGKCIVCHSSTGVAAGRSIHQFVTTTNPDHLTVNFIQFENLVNAKGSAYVLSKVQGGSAHEGLTVLVPGSPAYNSLSAFLTLLQSLAPVVGEDPYPY